MDIMREMATEADGAMTAEEIANAVERGVTGDFVFPPCNPSAQVTVDFQSAKLLTSALAFAAKLKTDCVLDFTENEFSVFIGGQIMVVVIHVVKSSLSGYTIKKPMSFPIAHTDTTIVNSLCDTGVPFRLEVIGTKLFTTKYAEGRTVRNPVGEIDAPTDTMGSFNAEDYSSAFTMDSTMFRKCIMDIKNAKKMRMSIWQLSKHVAFLGLRSNTIDGAIEATHDECNVTTTIPFPDPPLVGAEMPVFSMANFAAITPYMSYANEVRVSYYMKNPHIPSQVNVGITLKNAGINVTFLPLPEIT
jgi:hypothetical protein